MFVHSKKEDTLRISTFKLNHNHHLVTPTKIDMIETHRNIIRQLIDTLNKDDIGPSRMMNVLNTMRGERKNVGFCDTDIQNVV